MGFLSRPSPPPRNTENASSASNHLLSSDDSTSSSTSLSSQPSLPTLRSLTVPEPPPSVSNRCLATLKGHSSFVFALSLAGNHLFSGSHDGEIRVWPTHEYSSVVAIANGGSAVKSVVVMGDKLFSGHQDHKVRVWKIEDWQNDAVEGEKQPLRCVATLPTLEDRFLTLFSAKNYVRVRRHKTHTWVHHVDTVSALAVSQDGAHLYSASWDRTVKIWRISDFKCLESIPNAHDDAINAVAVSYDGRVYTGSADRKIKVWATTMESNKQRYSLLETLEKHKSAVNALALTQDGAVLYSGACDRSVVVWERMARGGETVVVGALRGHSKAILCLAVVGDELLCSGSADQTVRVWRRGLDRAYACLAVLEGHARPVKCLAAAVDRSGSGETESCLVYSGGLDCDIRVWRISIPSL